MKISMHAFLAALLMTSPAALDAGYLGVSGLQPVMAEEAPAVGLASDQAGLLIADVFPEGPAEKAGLAAGDILVRVDGIGVTDPRSLAQQIQRTPAGREIVMHCLRGGRPFEAHATITEPPVRPPTGIQGRKAPVWNVAQWKNLPEGKASLDISDYVGKVVYLFFFQKQCYSYEMGFPKLKRMAEHYKDTDDVAVVAVQTAFELFDKNTPEAAWKCAKSYKLTIPFGHDGQDGKPSRMFLDYRAGGTPWTVVIDQQGVVRANDFYIEPEKAIELIDRLRKERKEGGE